MNHQMARLREIQKERGKDREMGRERARETFKTPLLNYGSRTPKKATM